MALHDSSDYLLEVCPQPHHHRHGCGHLLCPLPAAHPMPFSLPRCSTMLAGGTRATTSSLSSLLSSLSPAWLSCPFGERWCW